MIPPKTDSYLKKTISFELAGHSLQFRVSDALFSSHEIDVGTKLLLRSLSDPKYNDRLKILDLGCGYGPIGITLKALNTQRLIQMIDRDALAVEYARQNALLNGFDDTVTYGSLGYDSVGDADFDLIVSNIPAKVGGKAIASFLYDAQRYLRPQGMVAIVVVRTLVPAVKLLLENNPAITITFEKITASYGVYHYMFDDSSPDTSVKTSFEQGVYKDSLDPETELAMNYLGKLKKYHPTSALFHNPGLGHLPVALSKLFKIKKMVMIDRDLLSLRYTQLNLQQNDFDAEKIVLLHAIGTDFSASEVCDLAIIRLREDEGTDASELTIRAISRHLAPKGIMVIVSTSTMITRLTDRLKGDKTFLIKDRKRNKGRSLLLIQQIGQ